MLNDTRPINSWAWKIERHIQTFQLPFNSLHESGFQWSLITWFNYTSMVLCEIGNGSRQHWKNIGVEATVGVTFGLPFLEIAAQNHAKSKCCSKLGNNRNTLSNWIILTSAILNSKQNSQHSKRVILTLSSQICQWLPRKSKVMALKYTEYLMTPIVKKSNAQSRSFASLYTDFISHCAVNDF